MKKGAHALFHGVWTYNVKDIEFEVFVNENITFTFILVVAIAQPRKINPSLS